jgi:plastocyanin
MRPKLLWQAGWLLIVSSTLHAGSITGKVTCTGVRDNANAVVYVERIEGKNFPPPKDPVVLNQKGKEFVPHVIPVQVGTTVNFVNGDPIAHNVFTPDKCAGKFDLGSWPQGETRSHTFTEPCDAVMLCKLHPEMDGYVIVIETPYFAVTDAKGAYVIPGVPDGTYNLSVWHERLKKQTRSVIVRGGTTADFTLTR